VQILVCVKQVRDPDSPIRIDAAGRAVASAPENMFRMNRFDEFALEEALRLREKFPGTRIDALSAGPLRAARTVRRALETGADRGIHLLVNDDSDRMPFEVASLIGAYARDGQYDLILTGVMAEDDMQAQVGPMLAEILGLPWATAVMAIGCLHPSGWLQVERELEGGRREVCELMLPALLTVQSGINRPRYPALSHVLRSRSQTILTLPVSQLREATAVPPPLPRERIVRLQQPVPMQTGLILPGDPGKKAKRLLQILQERALL
jgi:electron transfer flavoprotein beta subunit